MGNGIYLPPNWSDIKFGLYVTSEVLSLPCYLFVFYHLLIERTARKALHNHTTIVMLFLNFISLTIDLPLVISYSKRRAYVPFTPALCLLHQFLEYGIWYGAIMSMLWLSIERHILIFHSNLIRTARGRWLFHYIPLTLFSLYAPVFYFYIIFIYPCAHEYNPAAFLCSGPYYKCSFSASFTWYTSIFHDITPIMLIIAFTGGLLIRVLVQKRHLQHANGWRQNRKMILQFIFISVTYIILDGPSAILTIMLRLGITNFGSNVSTFVLPMAHIPAIIIPYATLITLPKLKAKLQMLIHCQKNRQVINPSIQQT